MTTAAETIPVDLIEKAREAGLIATARDRWEAATFDPQAFTDGTVSPSPNKRYHRIHDTIEDLAMRCVAGELDEAEAADLERFMDETYESIQERVTTWAGRTLLARAG